MSFIAGRMTGTRFTWRIHLPQFLRYKVLAYSLTGVRLCSSSTLVSGQETPPENAKCGQAGAESNTITAYPLSPMRQSDSKYSTSKVKRLSQAK